MQGNAAVNDTMTPAPALIAEPGAARSWNGPLSDVSFRSDFEEDLWQMTVRLEAEVPVMIQLAFETPEQLQEIADIFDFSLAVARAPADFSDHQIAQNALSLTLCRDRFLNHSIEINTALDEHAPSFDVGADVQRSIAANRASAASLHRISTRINDRLISAVGPAAPDLFSPGGGSGAYH